MAFWASLKLIEVIPESLTWNVVRGEYEFVECSWIQYSLVWHLHSVDMD